ncbi:MAG: hypothetical protein ABIC95_05440 [archaeon]
MKAQNHTRVAVFLLLVAAVLSLGIGADSIDGKQTESTTSGESQVMPEQYTSIEVVIEQEGLGFPERSELKRELVGPELAEDEKSPHFQAEVERAGIICR